MNILLLQLDGKIPNLALLRIARHHRDLGDHVWLRHAGNQVAVQPKLDEPTPAKVYASAIFTRSQHLAEAVQRTYPGALVGGTGVDAARTLQHVGIDPDGPVDYADYPRWSASIGFTQRGCRLRCPFCVVPKKEGGIRARETIAEIWRGEPWPRQILLLDNDFFGNPAWEDRVKELTDGKFKVCINQGINARMLNPETAAGLAAIDYRDDQFKVRRIYTALDNPKDRGRFLKGLVHLTDQGVRPYHIFVYLLVGYWKGESHADRDERRRAIRDFGALPYPMPYERTPELIGFQRWVVGGYDRTIPWEEWQRARYQPTNLRRDQADQGGLDFSA